jgi:hypothetical protein
MHEDYDHGVVLGDYIDPEGGVAFLSDEDRARHLDILGRTGTGKTTLIRAMAYDDLLRTRGFALLDPHGDIAELVADSIPIERENDVIYVDPTDDKACLALNPLYNVPPDRRPLVAEQIISSFSHIWQLSPESTPRLLYILYNGLRLLLDAQGSTLLGLQKLLNDIEYRNRLLRTCQDPAVRNFWEIEFAELSDRDAANAVASVKNKIGMILTGHLRTVLGQPKPTIDFRRAMDNAHVVIFNLSQAKLGEGSSHLLGAFIVMALQQAAESRADIPEKYRRPFTAYCDEYHDYATSSFLKGITASRKWKLSWVLSHQLMAQLPPLLARTVVSTIGSLAIFRIAGDDAHALELDLQNNELIYDQSKLQYVNIAEPINLTNTANFEAWMKLLDRGVPMQTRLVRTYLPQPAITGRLEIVKARSRTRHMRSRAKVEENIKRFLAPRPKKPKRAASPARGRMTITWPINPT